VHFFSPGLAHGSEICGSVMTVSLRALAPAALSVLATGRIGVHAGLALASRHRAKHPKTRS
jgi:hypothetical protein